MTSSLRPEAPEHKGDDPDVRGVADVAGVDDINVGLWLEAEEPLTCSAASGAG